MRLTKTYTTHMPVLMQALAKTTGDVLELGIGPFSTPLLHWACYGKRKLVSYESSNQYYKMNEAFKDAGHEIHLVSDFEDADIEKPWGLAFIDHDPALRRKEDIRRLANYATMIVVHDTQGRDDHSYKFSEIYPLFKYRFIFDKERPHTTVLSNFVDLKDFMS